MSLNSVIEDLTKNVDGAVGAAIVDLSSGLLLSVSHNVPYFTQSYLDAVSAAAVDLFRGRNVRTVEELLSGTRGIKVEHSIQEVQMATLNTYHFMAIVPNRPNALLVLITTKQANLGMGWSATRSVLPKLTLLCP